MRYSQKINHFERDADTATYLIRTLHMYLLIINEKATLIQIW